MKNQFEVRGNLVFLLLRICLAFLIAMHGWDRIINAKISLLSEMIATRLPFALFLASLVTVVEVLGTILFALGRFVFPLSLSFATVYFAAILIHHAPHGWFTSGAKEDGVEFALMLMLLFLGFALRYAPLSLQYRLRLRTEKSDVSGH